MRKKHIKNINLKYTSKDIVQQDSLHDSDALHFDCGIALDDVLPDHNSDIDKYLGHYNQSASKGFISIQQGLIILFCITAFSFFLMELPEIMIPAFLIFGSILHFSLTTIKYLMFSLKEKIVSLRETYFNSIKELFQNDSNDVDYPIYSILLPLLTEEKKVLEQLLEAISNLNYPKEKLQVLLILEANDNETINNLKEINSELQYDVIIVPDFKPRTKAKACNYALNFIKGEYVVIFDADDIPSPDQLKLVVERFKNQDPKLGCLQAKLNYYNADENLLTRLFSLEYAVLFDKLLPSLSQNDYPLPLGGTSNHFRADVLKELRGWDIYNLAEDAEIGMRLAMNGYKTETIDSYTAEESPVTVMAWIKQRSRWLKGFIQTYLLHLQKDNNLTDKIGARKSFVSMHFMLGLSTLSLLITPFMIGLGLSLALEYTTINSEINHFILRFSGISAGLWIINSMYQSVKTIKSSAFLKQMSAMKKIILTIAFPAYFILHAIAALYAVFDLIRRPFYWSKTKHGVTKNRLSIAKLFKRNR
jgi:cellulose synthase/poly-beta-1,6-N-acetylglucosamine synthase-like glycosyltransferase